MENSNQLLDIDLIFSFSRSVTQANWSPSSHVGSIACHREKLINVTKSLLSVRIEITEIEMLETSYLRYQAFQILHGMVLADAKWEIHTQSLPLIRLNFNKHHEFHAKWSIGDFQLNDCPVVVTPLASSILQDSDVLKLQDQRCNLLAGATFDISLACVAFESWFGESLVIFPERSDFNEELILLQSRIACNENYSEVEVFGCGDVITDFVIFTDSQSESLHDIIDISDLLCDDLMPLTLEKVKIQEGEWGDAIIIFNAHQHIRLQGVKVSDIPSLEKFVVV